MITLAIIGIVAAMTIPTLITNYQKNEAATRLKKAYSTLAQAVKLSEGQNGALSEWDYALDTDAFVKIYLKPYLSIAKDCGIDPRKGCLAEDMFSLNGASLTFVEGLGGDTNWWSAVLADGTSMAVYAAKPLVHNGAESRDVQVMFDINGLKKPNTMGKDVFHFWIFGNTEGSSGGAKNRGNENITGPLKSTGVYPDGYGFPRQYLSDDGGAYNIRRCNGKKPQLPAYSGHGGKYCTALVMLDGWKINYRW